MNRSDIRFYQFLPLYDVIHLGNVLGKGYSPTSGEMTWALIDGCFVVADVLSLAAIQPEGVVAAESIKTEVKAAVREGAKAAGNEVAESGAQSAVKAITRREGGTALGGLGTVSTANQTRRMARWWTVRSAGGVYEVMRRIPDALPRLGLAQIAEMAAPVSAKAGMRLSTWQPIRLFKDGAEVVLRIPPQRGLKYLAAQGMQAGVGVVGFRKMEEHLASRRPDHR